MVALSDVQRNCERRYVRNNSTFNVKSEDKIEWWEKPVRLLSNGSEGFIHSHLFAVTWGLKRSLTLAFLHGSGVLREFEKKAIVVLQVQTRFERDAPNKLKSPPKHCPLQ